MFGFAQFSQLRYTFETALVHYKLGLLREFFQFSTKALCPCED